MKTKIKIIRDSLERQIDIYKAVKFDSADTNFSKGYNEGIDFAIRTVQKEIEFIDTLIKLN